MLLFRSLLPQLCTLLACLLCGPLLASERLLISLKQDTAQLGIDARRPQLSRVANDTGIPLRWIRNLSGNAVVASASDADGLYRRLEAHPDVLFAEPDTLVARQTVPNDPLYGVQWPLQNPGLLASGIDAEGAWDLTHGSSSTVIAIIDTGVRFEHPDLTGRLLPGYDFVSEHSVLGDGSGGFHAGSAYLRAADGDGRDSDASDPGDGVSAAEQALLMQLGLECPVRNSSWHGTAMASIVAANGNDGFGLTGVDWHARILPVRAIGKCGGRRSDLLDAIRWAAGVPDPDLPDNPTPARLINLSLGVDDVCRASDQRAINDAVNAGAMVISAVGNGGRNTDLHPSSPSDCNNVLGVMAVDQRGQRASYSNTGADADMAAPGGEQFPSDFTIWVAGNAGETDPLPQHQYAQVSGTSVAAPHVTGVLSLMLSLDPGLSNEQLMALLSASARPFPNHGGSEDCRPELCGAGLLDARNAAEAVLAADLPEADAQNDRSPTESEAPAVRPARADDAADQVQILGVVRTGAGVACSIGVGRSRTHDPMFAVLISASLLLLWARSRTRRSVARLRRN